MARFEKGASGNPEGRPKGIPDKRTRLSRLLEDRSEQLVKKAVDLALSGDGQALRLCIERLIPKARDETLAFTVDAPFPMNAPGLVEFSQKIAQRMLEGTITPQETLTVMSIVEAQRRIIETSELSQRVEALEQTLKARRTK